MTLHANAPAYPESGLMSRTTFCGVILAVLIGTISGTFLLFWDGARRVLGTDRDWGNLAPRDGP